MVITCVNENIAQLQIAMQHSAPVRVVNGFDDGLEAKPNPTLAPQLGFLGRFTPGSHDPTDANFERSRSSSLPGEVNFTEAR
jgi:hypothetical protein